MDNVLNEMAQFCLKYKSSRSYTLDGNSIVFHPCGIRSHNPNDVANRYCAVCHQFIPDREVPMEQRR
jgi:hypothetical protein